MLVLSRKIEEAINIGGSITIKVLSIQDGQVKLGIEAPPQVLIYRTEIHNQIEQENMAAAKALRSSVVKVAGVFKRKRAENNARE